MWIYMDENRQDKDLNQAEFNKDSGTKISKKTRHTWIGDKDEVRPDAALRPVSRMTLQDSEERGTRIVTREKKPYKGFITDDEVKYAEAAAEVDRRSRAEGKAAREALAQTRVYSGIGSGLDDGEKEPEESKPAQTHPHKSIRVRVTDSRKFKRLIALAVVLVCLLAFEISFFVMKAETASLPGRTEKTKAQTEDTLRENEKIQGSIDEIGDYDRVKDNRDSWLKIRDKLAE